MLKRSNQQPLNSITLIPLHAEYLFPREKGKLDRIDKILLILPLLPLADLSSTLFALSLGGEEVGILARPILENYGAYGLVMLTASASIMFFIFMQVVIHIKNLFINEWKIKWMRYALTISTYWLFTLEAVYVSTVIMNFLTPMSPLLTQTITPRILLASTYLACVSAVTIPQMRQHPHF